MTGEVRGEPTTCEITNRKVAGLEPRWREYRGFSLLFDNPGASLAADGGLLRVACSPAAGGVLDLYARLRDGLESLGRESLRDQYGFCPLPPASYHVTAWDGVNDGNRDDLPAEARLEWADFLRGLPGTSRSAWPGFLHTVARSELVRWTGSLSFRYRDLALWGNQVLVARLGPAAGSERGFAELVLLRDALARATAEVLGVSFGPKPDRPYQPHVSLGYFANETGASRALDCVGAWTEEFEAALRDSSVTYGSVNAYGFTDMASFFRLP